MQELLLLLLPIAAASGWWAARRNVNKTSSRTSCDSSPEYFRGLNYLLNEEPDKAIDVFVQMLEVDSDTVETHLALGNLFRRRGEVERAIRLHQNLIARPALTREQRGQALLELGKDYMRAGLFDRAENLFKELRDMGLYSRRALENLHTIYQQEKDWDSCLKVAEELAHLINDPLLLERSHYYCELAVRAIKAQDFTQAQALLKKAQSTYKGSVRAIHLQADIAAAKQDYKTAVRLLRQAGEADPDYLPEILPALAEHYKKLGELPQLKSYLEGLLNQNQYNTNAALLLTDHLKENKGESQATEFLGAQLQRAPSLKGLLRLIELSHRVPNMNEADILIQLREHIQRLLEERPHYQCSKCGFVAKTLHWQCPSCRSWSSIKRKPDIEEQPQASI